MRRATLLTGATALALLIAAGPAWSIHFGPDAFGYEGDDDAETGVDYSWVDTVSGGTEATAFNPRAVAVMQRAGFVIEKTTGGDNPVYTVRYGDVAPAMEAFSKVYNDPPNPSEDYCAVMTCSQADANCPIVHGAAERVSIPFGDPKDFDGTDRETAKYDERCRQISVEMLYVFSRVTL